MQVHRAISQFMLVSAPTIAAGLIFLLVACSVGAISEFISKPVLKGFVFGSGLTIMVKQAQKLMGIPAGRENFSHQAGHVAIGIVLVLVAETPFVPGSRRCGQFIPARNAGRASGRTKPHIIAGGET